MKAGLAKHLVLSSILVLAPAARGLAGEEESLSAPRLFPFSVDCLEVDSLPRVSNERLNKLAPRLKEALRPLTSAVGFESPGCSISEHFFEEPPVYIRWTPTATAWRISCTPVSSCARRAA